MSKERMAQALVRVGTIHQTCGVCMYMATAVTRRRQQAWLLVTASQAYLSFSYALSTRQHILKDTPGISATEKVL